MSDSFMLEFLGLQQHARLVITDSGGIQEETTCLGIPCLTMRDTTERPVTVTLGTNELLGRDTERLKIRAREILNGSVKQGAIPPLWDGRAGDRVAVHVLGSVSRLRPLPQAARRRGVRRRRRGGAVDVLR
jgi:UDP-N-acetylglucosamine 2-epimerase (non-hydrolysing)